MRYDNYRNKVLRLSDFLTKVVKHRVLISCIAGTIFTILIALWVTIGLPGRVTADAEIIYGDAYSCQAKAFLSTVRYVYSPEGSEQWSTDQPYLPGTYQVRAVGRSVFGKDRPGKPTTFRILPLPLTIQVRENTITFGDAPTFVSDATKYGDQISCGGFVYDDLTAPATDVVPDVRQIQVLDVNGQDVTYAYNFQPQPVRITFNKRPLQLLVDSASKFYDGTALTSDQYQTTGGSLGLCDSITAVFTGSQLEVGSSENTSSFAILHTENSNVLDVTAQYDLSIIDGTLTVDQIPLHITTGTLEAVYCGQPIQYPEYTVEDSAMLLPGHWIEATFVSDLINCGTYNNIATFRILDAQGRDMTAYYSITSQWGTIKITPAPLSVRTESATWVYDGTDHTHPVYTVEGLLPHHQIQQPLSSAAIANITNVGTKKNQIQLTILDQNGNNVTANYHFTNEFGTLEVTKRPITVTTQGRSWVYDDQSHFFPSVDVENVVPGHTWTLISWTEIRDVGTKENQCRISIQTPASQRSQTVTSNYEIAYVYGTLEVTKRPLTVTTGSNSWIYDGMPHSYGGYTANNLVPGHGVQLFNCATITDVGKVTNQCEAKVVDQQDNRRDLTANYDIRHVYGTLQMNPRPITVSVWDTEKVYDGTPLYGGDPYVPADSPYPLVEGHTLSATVTGSRTEVGVSSSSATKCQVFEGTRDVTFNYTIRTTNGKITIWQARVQVTAASAAKYYDGTPLTDPTYTVEVLEGSMKAGHSVRATVSGSITNPGIEPNKISAKIVDSYGRDVSSNYLFYTQEGTLKIVESESQEEDHTIFGRLKDDQDGYIYIREYSQGDYTGQDWTGAVEYGKTLPGGLSYNYLSSIAIRNSGGYIHVAEFRDMLIYMLPYYMSEDGNYTIPSTDVDYTSIQMPDYSLSYYTLPSIEDGFDYLKGQLGEYAPYEAEYRKFVYEWYLNIDNTTRSYMQSIIDQQEFSLSDPQVILKIARYIQNAATYNMDYPRSLDMEENVAIAFLDTYKEGKCTHYAMAATLLYRTLGIPARYTVGWMLQTQKDTFVDIKNPGHAWVEVYIDGVGWIQVEVTGPDPNAGESGGGDKPSITVTPSYSYKKYDGQYLFPQQKVDADPTLYSLLEEGFTYQVHITGQQLQPGSSQSIIESFTLYDPSGKDVTENYHITYEEGLLEVFNGNIEIIRIYLYQLQKYYDGTPLTYRQDDFALIQMSSGLALNLSLNISLSEPGYLRLSDLNRDFDQYASFDVYQNGKNITSNCRVIFDVFDRNNSAYLPICLDRRPLEITSISQSKVDDGTPLSNSTCFITRGSLIRGHRLVAKATGSIDTVGSDVNTLTTENIQILDASGKDVSIYYTFHIIEGTLTITPPSD